MVITEQSGVTLIHSPPTDYMTSQKCIHEVCQSAPYGAMLHAISNNEAERIAKQQADLKEGEVLAYGQPQMRLPPIVKTDWPRCLLSLRWYARFVSRVWQSFIS